ncbi:hypothetical protein BGX26_010724 [Mortierella sp. AD094]|nr:hypothetical protein BGX26_010724 [Mortierella sp. AD094]
MVTTYLKGVEEAVYYSSLTDGLAGGIMAAAPENSAVKSLGYGTIIGSLSKLAVEIHMAQSVSRLAKMGPFDERVRAMTKGVGTKIPDATLKTLQQQAAVILVTEGSGRYNGRLIPQLACCEKHLCLSSDVLSTNRVGDALKFVFCSGGLDQPTAVNGSTVNPTDAEKAQRVEESKKSDAAATPKPEEKEEEEKEADEEEEGEEEEGGEHEEHEERRRRHQPQQPQQKRLGLTTRLLRK